MDGVTETGRRSRCSEGRRPGSVLRSTAYVMRRPLEVVVRRVPTGVVVEVVDGLDVEDGHSWTTP